MRLSLYILMISLLISCGPKLATDAENGLNLNSVINDEQNKIIYEIAKKYHNNTQIAFAFIKNGHLSYYGIKRENNVLNTIDNQDAVFEIGSITKIFTSTLLAELAIESKLKLKDPINSAFPFKIKNDIQITYESLANHTSGLPRLPSKMLYGAILNMDNPYVNFDSNDMNDYLTNDIELDEEAGKVSAYSNLGAGLLAYTLETITDKSFETLLQEKIFKKYGMTSSTTNRELIQDRLVLGQNDEGETTSNWDFQSLAGAGAVLSNVEDLSKFALAHFDSTNSALNLTRKETFQVSEKRRIGLNWVLFDRENGDKWIWHNGATGGYRSSMVLSTKDKNGVIILSNVSAYDINANNIDKLSFELMNTLFEKVDTFNEVTFLEGTWKVEGKKRFEAWDFVAGSQFKGIGYTLSYGNQNIFENLEIKMINNELVYEATVHDQNDGKTIQFKRNSENKEWISFENMNHDFPKKIQYKKITDTEIEVNVSGGDKVMNYKIIKQKD